MARVTHVRRAQQRYATVPVLDENGQPVRTPVMGKNGEQKRSKRGLTFMTKTVADKTRPLPNHTCGKCGVEIKVGDPYKHISPKSGPYGGRTMYRCAACPTWQVWDYSSSLSARTAQIAYDYDNEVSGAESPDDVTSALETAAEAIREIAEEKRESASNIEDGFGHATEKSEELESIADDLDSWADEVEQAEVPDVDDFTGCENEDCDGGKVECDSCESGKTTDDEGNEVDCDECDDEGKIDCSECEGEGDDFFRVDDWREEVRSNVTIVDECPV